MNIPETIGPMAVVKAPVPYSINNLDPVVASINLYLAFFKPPRSYLFPVALLEAISLVIWWKS